MSEKTEHQKRILEATTRRDARAAIIRFLGTLPIKGTGHTHMDNGLMELHEQVSCFRELHGEKLGD